jgi:hypothetical protein
MAFMRYVEVTVGPKNGTGFKIDGLKISFHIEKTDSSEPNKATIKIYNLTQETSAKVTVADNHIQLRAGYNDETIAAIFFGTVVDGWRIKEGEDYVTELKVQDGRSAVMGGYVSISYSKDVAATTVAADILNAIGLPYKGQENIPSGENYPSGFAYMGMAIGALRKVLDRFSLTYTIQNEMLYILKEGQAADKTGLRLTPKTGLLTLPQPISDKTTEDDSEAEAKSGWKFSAMLFPELLPGAACKVEASTFSGDMLIHKTIYEGDNWDGPFKIDIEAEAM